MIFQKKQFPNLINLHKIWSHEDCSITPYLIYFKDFWLCAYTEYSNQLPNRGTIRLIISKDKIFWSSAYLFEDSIVDFRNAKLSIASEGKLMVIIEGSSGENELISKQSYVSFSDDGFNWSIPIPILQQNKWIWSLVWRRGKAFAICASETKDTKNVRKMELLLSQNGLDFLLITSFDILGYPIDASLAFQKDRLLCVVSRGPRGANYSLVGSSTFPFYVWEWQATQYYIKDAILASNEVDDELWVVGCLNSLTPYGITEKIALMRMYSDCQLEPVLTLPGHEEVGSPNILIRENKLFICYHSQKNSQFYLQLAEISL